MRLYHIFFVGRPAYKKELDLEPRYWELPVCFIIEFDVETARHIYPFDTGGFSKLPNFIALADMQEYNVSSDPNAVEKIIGTFFADNKSYFRGKPRSETEFISRFKVDVLDEEVQALHTLVASHMPKASDDRRSAIEVAFPYSISLSQRKVLAVVMPEIYLRSREISSFIQDKLGATIITYPESAQNINFYYACIYQKVDQFYQNSGLYRV